jgi:hypothetical protein
MDEGVRQGCAAAPFFFHLALSLALEQPDADLRKSVHCVADDVLICGLLSRPHSGNTGLPGASNGRDRDNSEPAEVRMCRSPL